MEIYRPSLPYIDLFLADLKHVADAPFKQWTDGNAAVVLDNLKTRRSGQKNHYPRATDSGL